MAHFILEHSENLTDDELKARTLFAALHQAMNDTGIYPLAGLRSRAFRADNYYVANGDESFAYLHLNFRIGPGRTEEEQALTFSIMKDIVLKHFKPLTDSRPLALSFEISELSKTLRHNQNNIREYIKS